MASTRAIALPDIGDRGFPLYMSVVNRYLATPLTGLKQPYYHRDKSLGWVAHMLTYEGFRNDVDDANRDDPDPVRYACRLLSHTIHQVYGDDMMKDDVRGYWEKKEKKNPGLDIEPRPRDADQDHGRFSTWLPIGCIKEWDEDLQDYRVVDNRWDETSSDVGEAGAGGDDMEMGDGQDGHYYDVMEGGDANDEDTGEDIVKDTKLVDRMDDMELDG